MTNKAAMDRYHRWVAQQPCMNCDVEGFSQTSHYQGLHGSLLGRGAGMKVHDMAVTSLCCDRSGIEGCHTLFDNNKLYTSTGDSFMQKIDFSETHLCWEMQTIIAAYKAGILKVGE